MEKHQYPYLKMSYIRTPLTNLDFQSTIPDRIRELAKTKPDKLAFVFREPGQPRHTLTRNQVEEKADWLARHLIGNGIKPGDKIAMFVDTGPNWIVTYFGINIAGATAINSPSFDENEFRNIAKRLGCVAMVSEELSKLQKRRVVLTTLDPAEYKTTTFDLYDLTKNDPAPDVDLPKAYGDDESVMTLTSGSTGSLKLVLHTHASLLTGTRMLMDLMQVEEYAGLFAIDRPMAWIGGYPMAYVGKGCGMTYIKAKVNSEEDDEFFVYVLSSERPYSAFLMEYRLNSLHRRPDLLDRMPFLPAAMTAGQRISPKSIERMLCLAESVFSAYASSECLHAVGLKVTTAERFEFGTAGYLSPGCEVKVVDDKEEVVSVETPGELCFRGPACAKGYVYLDGSTSPVVDKDGWYHTGDVALIRPDGRIVIVGRKTEILKRATVKIYPAFVEKKIQENFEEIEEVVVVGTSDKVLYQEICACIMLKPEAQITTDDIKRRAVDIFKPSLSPDGLGYMPGHFLLMDSFPRTTTGKYDRLSLTKMAEDMIKCKLQKT